MKLKNKLFKSCLTGLVLSANGIAGAAADPNLSDYSAVSGSAMNIAAGSIVKGKLAASAALTIGSGAFMGLEVAQTPDRPDIYAGAAVTIGASATIGNVISGAAAGIGANANANDVTAGAAVTLGANAHVRNIAAGAAITMGAGSTAVNSISMIPVITSGAGSNASCTSTSTVTIGGGNCPIYTPSTPTIDDVGDLNGVLLNAMTHMTFLKSEIVEKVTDAAVARASAVDDGSISNWNELGTNIPDDETLIAGKHYGSAVNIPANATLNLDAEGASTAEFVFDLSGALTFGAGSKIVLINPYTTSGTTSGTTWTITWITGGSINMGAGTEFRGVAYSAGSINAATSSVDCGGLYAAGAVSVKSIGSYEC